MQIGIVALMGLAAKNAILIVEFAKEAHERQGKGLAAAAVEGARLRFRPIMMTAFAFILGVVPLVTASGAGAAARLSIGIAVFAGMLMASTVGLFFIPMLYVIVQSAAYFVGRQPESDPGKRDRPACATRRESLMRRAIPIVCFAVTLAGCMVGPNYKRPVVTVPPAFRAGEQQPTQVSLGDAKWFDIFQDDVLRDLIRDALAANYDIRIAAQRVLGAEGQVSATRSAMFPEINAQAVSSGYGDRILESSGRITDFTERLGSRIFSANCAAPPRPPERTFFALDENRKGIMQTLVSQVSVAVLRSPRIRRRARVCPANPSPPVSSLSGW